MPFFFFNFFGFFLKDLNKGFANNFALLFGIRDTLEQSQKLIRRMPIADNVVEYAVGLTAKARPAGDRSPQMVKDFLSWGAGPRASQYLVIGAKVHAAVNGKFSPDIEDVQAVALPILRHRIVRNYKAEAEGYSIERIVQELL